ALGQVGPDDLGQLPRVRHVDLVQRDQPGTVGQCRVVLVELALECLDVGDGVPTGFLGRAIDDVQQHGAAFDVPEELDAETPALCRARNQPRHVGDRVGRAACLYHAQVGLQGGERVVGDLRPGRGERGDQRGLAGAGEADGADIGDALELEDEVPALPRLAEQRVPGRLATFRGERVVAETAAA